MKGKIKYTDEPIGKVKVVADFLPSTKELFKKEAKKYNTQYQKMIRRLLDEYTAHQ